jgi:hypothetical protein
MLHLDISIGDDNFLIDPGTYVYTSDIELRNRYRSENSHNGPALDGSSMVHPTDPFGWKIKPDCNATACFAGQIIDCVSANYTLQQETQKGAVISRSVMFLHDGFWIIRDTISSDQPRNVQWNFISPCETNCEGDVAVLRGKEKNLIILSAFSSLSGFDSTLLDTQYSEDYLSRKPAFALRYGMMVGSRAQGLFLMIPTTTMDPPFDHQVFSESDRTALTFNLGNHAYTLSTGEKESGLAGIQTDAEFVLLDRYADHVHSCLLIGGSRISLEGNVLLRFSSKMDYVYAHWQNGILNLETSTDEPLFLEQSKLINRTILKNLAN